MCSLGPSTSLGTRATSIRHWPMQKEIYLVPSEVEGRAIAVQPAHFAATGKNFSSQARITAITRGFSWLNMK